jgi:hypothetical protein
MAPSLAHNGETQSPENVTQPKSRQEVPTTRDQTLNGNGISVASDRLNGENESTGIKLPRLKISQHYTVSEDPIGTIRPIRIIGIGAGASGINLAYQVKNHMKKTDVVIYEKNPSVGGTWYENRYPGCKCDIRK